MRGKAVWLLVGSLCLLSSCTSDEESVERNEGVSLAERYEALRTAPFEQPLPNDLGLTPLTTFNKGDYAVVGYVDLRLTNADEGTGFVVTYFLAPDAAEANRLFEEEKSRTFTGKKTEAGAVIFDPPSVPMPTHCFVAPGETSSSCISKGDSFYVQVSYLPAETVDTLEEVMAQAVSAAHAHYSEVIGNG